MKQNNKIVLTKPPVAMPSEGDLIFNEGFGQVVGTIWYRRVPVCSGATLEILLADMVEDEEEPDEPNEPEEPDDRWGL